ncbi:MAG: Glycerol-1-phosphate dehydrogenase [NAD(P)+] [Candidatus Heimdallarchaeota archaeon LC_3]|nr:MAG: Glycerol-1-phosphate dehydrogenase [NAD(P)+] [Candidatus Heimdallarchaeota archaeon LC_3]
MDRQSVIVPRLVAYGSDAINKISDLCKKLNLKSLLLVSGSSNTKNITEKEIKPLITKSFNLKVMHLDNNISDLDNINKIRSEINSKQVQLAVVAIGGGKIMDIVKVATHKSIVPWISIPTSASHDGFSSPFINFILRERLKKANLPIPKSNSPLAIIGDTSLISRAPFEHVIAGVGDLLAKTVAVKDWQLATRIRGEYYDEYAATFGLMSARIVEEGYKIISKGKEPGIRLVVKALGNSGIAMAIAGNTRPASGSEHLISHYLDKMSHEQKNFIPNRHGFQVGLASVLCCYLQGGKWKNILNILSALKHPITANELGLDKEILLEAMINAHKIRPERYTVLGNGLTKKSALKALEATGIA